MLVTSVSPFSHNVSRRLLSWDFLKVRIVWCRVHSLSNNKFLDWSKLKAHADDKINVTRKQKFLLGLEENIAGKGENAGYQHFLLFPTVFSKNLYHGREKSGLCGKGLIKAYRGNSSY